MGWSKSFWSGCQYTSNLVREGLVAVLDFSGNAASLLSGTLSAFSYALDESVSAGYYGSANIQGAVHVNITLLKLAYSIIESFPFSQPVEKHGSFTDNIADNIDPVTLQMWALIALGSGIALKTIASSLGLYIQSMQDCDKYRRKEGVELTMPGCLEYIYAGSKSVTGALTIGFSVHGIVLAFLDKSGLVTHSYKYTHPKHSSNYVQTDDYTGPVEQDNITIIKNITRYFNVTLFGVKEPARLNVLFNGTADALGSAGVTFDNKGIDTTSIAPSLSIALLTGIAHRIFAERAKTAYDNRVFNVGQEDDDSTRTCNEQTALISV